MIIKTFNEKTQLENYSVVLDYDQIKEKSYSLAAGQYFDAKIEYTELTQEEFKEKIKSFKTKLATLYAEGKSLETEVSRQLGEIYYE
jgi:type I restriction enzyme M protein